MAIVRIENGFPTIRREVGVLLAGILVNGHVNPGDFIITDKGEVPILEVEQNAKTFPHIGLIIPNDTDAITYKDFGKEFKIKNVR